MKHLRAVTAVMICLSLFSACSYGNGTTTKTEQGAANTTRSQMNAASHHDARNNVDRAQPRNGNMRANAVKKVLFDNTHGETAGQADWVIDGGFSDFANGLTNAGFTVNELRKSEPITISDLQGYDVFVLPEPNIPFKKSEQEALLQYVQGGGGLFFIADHYNADRNKNRWDATEIFNGYRRGAYGNPTKGMGQEERQSARMADVTSEDWLGRNFGVRFRFNAVGNVVTNKIAPSDQTFGITNQISKVSMHAGSTLAILDPKKVKGIVYLPNQLPKWSHAVDQGVYEGGKDEGPYAAISKLGAGKAAFIGDSSPVEDATPKYRHEETGARKRTHPGFTEQGSNNGKLLVQIVDWLSKKESYTDFTQANIQLDQATSLLPFEQPQQSTEPEHEPWGNTTPGYKWWDSSTFKPGSYK
ncbi:hypothetical protein IFO66_06565 [Paenibacillus sp. CAU 1523]|uniref:DNA-binding protein n=1 Tax=Paenibacillus arenosi TaxID=2774142 RepID=A0ABR9AV10_9BACL|nr:hypothetical protein [Paenibacillus arenosi]